MQHSLRSPWFGEIEGCTSQHYHFDTSVERTYFQKFRSIFVPNRECVKSTRRMTFHASILSTCGFLAPRRKCLRLSTEYITCDTPPRRIVLAISRVLLWSPDSLHQAHNPNMKRIPPWLNLSIYLRQLLTSKSSCRMTPAPPLTLRTIALQFVCPICDFCPLLQP